MKQSQRDTTAGILFTDEYQLTMAQLYFRYGLHETTAQFDHFFRSYPNYGVHQAGYCINAGLEWLLDWMETAHFRPQDIDYLRRQTGQNGRQLFADDFLQYLSQHGHFRAITIDAIPEGRVVHANVPLTIIRGPLALAQILETSLLNHLNYQTLIATKASRIRQSGRGQVILEFGLRRAQGLGGNAGARAALIGGAHFTSNVGVSHVLGFPPKGTHAHSMVQVFMAMGAGELEAFRAYADVYPDDCLLLVDTIDTLHSGIPNAIRVFTELKSKGHRPIGIRLDSGDLAYLSIQAARMLDQAGFTDTVIVLSNQLDELTIMQILTQIEMEAPRYGIDADNLLRRLTFGVGTNLITSLGSPALGGVYKLVALRQGDGAWMPAIKISESPAKTPNPGHKRVWRIYDERGQATADLLTLDHEDPRTMDPIILRHPTDHTKYRALRQSAISEIEPLLQTVYDQGRVVSPQPPIDVMRQRRQADLERLDPGVQRILNPHIYHVSLSDSLWQLKQSLIHQAREGMPVYPQYLGGNAA